ncbi:LysR family transcriptional regulator [Colwellia asteriadis]|uniref:LysR family transcriptional regulator n=1 Tax=Colwellia asteriadis TaxID=517723 RepID=A0ABN1L5M9_9GAMM
MSKINQLESLKVLKAVVEGGSFTAAAKRLNLTVARVSKSVERLEAELNAKLFIRSTRHMQLTDSGERTYHHAIKLLEQWRGLTDELTETLSEPKGSIRISIPMSWGLCVFSKLLARFMLEYPKITIDVNMSDQYVNVIEGEYDLALRLARQLEDSSLLCKKLKAYQFITCASPDYLAKYGTPSTPEELKNHAGLLYSQQGSKLKWQFIKDNKITDVYINPDLQSNNSALFKETLLAGRGIGLIPEFIIKEELLSGKLQPILSQYTNPSLNLYSLRAPSNMLPMRVRLLIEFIEKQLQ